MRLIDADALQEALRDFEKQEPTLDYIMGTMRAGVIIDKQPTIFQWIPVSERLPEVVDYVLITFEEINGMHRVDKAICCSHGWQTETRYINFDKVFAWMPLPKPYKEKE